MSRPVGLSQRRRQLVGRLRHRKTREREGLVLVEGVRAVGEALDAGAATRFAVISGALQSNEAGAALLERLSERVEVERLDDRELASLSDTRHPQGVLLVCSEPSAPELRPATGRFLALDGIQDPGNVGTLVRAAVGFGVDGVLALDGTVDPWSAKTVRASAGTIFRVPVYRLTAAEALSALRAAGVPVLVADADGRPVGSLESSSAFALVLGNEGAGPRSEVRAAGLHVAVPMRGPAESLNVGMAGAILLYELTRES